LRLTLLGVCLLPGCVRMPQPHPIWSPGWNPVPSLSWRQRTDDHTPPKLPTVAANAGTVSVAGTAPDEAAPPDDVPSAIVAADPPGRVLLGSAESPDDPFLTDEAAAIQPASATRVQQLKQALSADAEQESRTSSMLAGLQPLRLRIDALVRRAMQLQRDGQLEEAHSTAQRAVELAEAGQVEFLPTEDRPTDLLRQISTALSAPTIEAAAAAERTMDGSVASTASAPLPRSPVVLRTRDDRASTGEPSHPPGAAGRVVANRALSAPRPAVPVPSLATDPPPNSAPAVAPGAALASPAERSPTRDHLSREPDRAARTDLPTPARAPEPPVIDPLQPLPKFRSPTRPATGDAVAALDAIPMPGTGLRGWSLWGPVFSLSGIGLIVGLGLLLRELGNRRARSSN
jgi:hypothetical protein